VVALPSYLFDLQQVEPKDWQRTDIANFDYYAAIAAGNDPHPTRNYKADHPAKWTLEEIAEGDVWAAECNAQRRADAKARVDGLTVGLYLSAKLDERIAKVEERKAAGYYAKWQNLGWCGRLDLAQKLFSTAQGQRYARVAILPAEVK